ncbi:hypothetical protein [Streptomyces lanatus]|uniref:Uncharacterized protein n=1 Tax=Streptomyces lanatus TaxID=66900 RepID=A0ABV1XQ01_9ACTN|nr:hypothetical protein [Streptomyces lanatus]GHG88065.1 hypothetical protein GCM10018780_06180 [Streptomyces lanatus]
MALATRHPGSARLEEGRPWSVRITYAQGWHGLRLPSAMTEPTWDDIDGILAENGYVRQGVAPGHAPRAGDEFDVTGWSPRFFAGPRRWDEDPGPAGPPQDVAVALPLAEVGEIRQALDTLRTHHLHPDRTAQASALIDALDAIGTVTVTLPTATANTLYYTLSTIGPWTEDLDEDTVRTVDALTRHLDLSHPVAGSWPHVRETLHHALHEALSLPGPEGLTARDDLLDVLRRFTDAHGTAVAAGDAEQGRLQAGRAEP